MKKNIFLFLTLCSILLNIVLGTYLNMREPKCEHIHLEIDRTKNVIPNEKAAEKIAEIFISSLQEDEFRWIQGREHGVEISYDDQRYEWIVDYDPNVNAEEEGTFVLDRGKTVWIRRDYGIVTGFLWR